MSKKLLRLGAIVVTAFAAVLLTPRALTGQGEGALETPPEAVAMQKALVEQMEVVDRMAALVGVWDGKGVFHSPTGKLEFTGVETIERVCRDRWLRTRFEGEFMGMPFDGEGGLGYDPLEQEVVSTWMDSSSTEIGTLRGKLSEDGKSWTLEGRGRDAMTGERKQERHVNEMVDPNHRRFRILMVMPDGSEQPAMEFEFVRRR